MFSFTFLIIIIGLKMIIPGLLRLKESNTISPYIVDICKKRWPITDLTGAAFYQLPSRISQLDMYKLCPRSS